MGTITPNTTNSVQPENAKTAVQLCSVTFAQNPVNDIGTLMPGWKIVWNGTQSLDANYAFIAVDATGDNYVLAFRGSVPPQGFSDWDVFANWILEDLNVVAQVNWPYASTSKARISAGAYIAFSNILYMKDSLGSDLSINDYLLANVVGNGKQLIITGHSLGGNLANIFASYYVQTLTSNGQSSGNVSLYTFAAPSAGNSDFANDLDAKLPAAWHYQNANDIVPNFPVFDGLVFTSLLYLPQPLAANITVTFNQQTVSLREAFLLLAGVFLSGDYQQPKTNYTIFGTELYPKYENNTAEQWFGQAGAQHALVNYANYLGVKLPVALARQPLVQAV